MSTVTGSLVHNSVTLQIDDELITYSEIDKDPPYAFTKCKRGAWNTRVSSHAKGAKVHHLQQAFKMFIPDVNSTLFAEVAENTAYMYNYCGFDMCYLDALDQQHRFGGEKY